MPSLLNYGAELHSYCSTGVTHKAKLHLREFLEYASKLHVCTSIVCVSPCVLECALGEMAVYKGVVFPV